MEDEPLQNGQQDDTLIDELPNDDTKATPDATTEEDAPIDGESGDTETSETTDADGDESQSEEQPQRENWVNNLRKLQRELKKENNELKAKLSAVEQKAAPQQSAFPPLGARPKLEDFDFDTAAHDKAIDAWYSLKLQHDQHNARLQAAAEAEQKEWENKRARYRQDRAEAEKADRFFEEAEFAVQRTLSEAQQSIILHAFPNPARVVAMLGRDLDTLGKLAKTTDPITFAVELTKTVEAKKMTATTKPKPAPERGVPARATSGNTGSAEKRLEQLRADAAKSGDYSKVIAYKASLQKR